MNLEKCEKNKCNPTVDFTGGRHKVQCDTCGLETLTYTSELLAEMAWNNNQVFDLGKKVEEPVVEDAVESIPVEKEVKKTKSKKTEEAD